MSEVTPDAPASTGLLDAVVAIGSGLDLDQTLRRIVEAAADLVDARYGALGVLDSSGSIGQFLTTGLPDAEVEGLGEPPHGLGILGLLVTDPRPLRLADLTTHPASVGFPDGHPMMRSFLGVPVRVRDEVFGNLYLTEKRHGRTFTEEDEQVVVALGAAAGVAIDNARMFAQSQTRTAWLRASFDVVTAVLQGKAPSVVTDLAIRRARDAAGCDTALLALLDEDGLFVIEQGAGDDAAALLGKELDVIPSNAGAVMRVPLVSGDHVLGQLVLVHRSKRSLFARQHAPLIENFAAQVALSLELAHARRERERLAILEDRDRIARDLHDLVIQRLFATGMMLQGAARAAEDSAIIDRIERAVQELDATILEVRSTIFALHEGREAPGGLRARLLREVGAAAHSLGFEPRIRFDGPIDSVVPEEVTEHVVAALREALSNVARHARATSVRVSVSVDDTDVVVIVTDNGVGMSGASSRRSGLANLERRAQSLQGSCVVEAAPDAGTRVTWRAPVRAG